MELFSGIAYKQCQKFFEIVQKTQPSDAELIEKETQKLARFGTDIQQPILSLLCDQARVELTDTTAQDALQPLFRASARVLHALIENENRKGMLFQNTILYGTAYNIFAGESDEFMAALLMYTEAARTHPENWNEKYIKPHLIRTFERFSNLLEEEKSKNPVGKVRNLLKKQGKKRPAIPQDRVTAIVWGALVGVAACEETESKSNLFLQERADELNVTLSDLKDGITAKLYSSFVHTVQSENKSP